MREEESLGINNIPFSTFAIHDGNETSRPSACMGSGFMLKEHHELSSHGINRNSFAEKWGYSVPSCGEDASSANFRHWPTKTWDKPIVNNYQFLSAVREWPPYKGVSKEGLLIEQAIAKNTVMNTSEFLATQIPGFAAESLVEVPSAKAT